MGNLIPDFAKYFEDMRVRVSVIDEAKKEIDRLVAPDFNLFSMLLPDEVRLSNMIARLLYPSESHGQGRKFLDAFLDILDSANPSDPIAKIKEAWKRPKNIKVELEQTTGMIEASQRRMDILISGESHGLMIENKPWAMDQKDQLTHYHEELSRRFSGRHAMIYLSGDGTPPSEDSLTKKDFNDLVNKGELLVIAYRPHLTNWLLRCLEIAEADRVRWIIKDFLTYIETEFPIPTSNTLAAG